MSPRRAGATLGRFAAAQHGMPGGFGRLAGMVAALADSTPQLAPRISAPGLRRALVAGVSRVIARREALNRINVFPVPDGDTGSNLAFTLSRVLSGALSRRARSVGALLRAVAEDAIDGARGNSGAILAQFLYGASEVASDATVLTPSSLAQAARAGAEQARGALAEPREGTILSVIQAFADALGASPPGRRGEFAAWFGRALQRAQAALADTPRQLPVLRQAGVVDAGAQGFVDLLEGIGDFIARRETGPLEMALEETRTFAGEHWHEEADASRPWCSECLIEADALDRAALHAALAELGAGSVVLAGGRGRIHLHAHVAEPAALFELAARFGRVSQHKAEDMRGQHASATAAAALAIVTDSGADLPREWLTRYRIQMVPARLSFGGEEFIDKVSISPAEFYRRLRASAVLPQTSQPPPGDFRRVFDQLLSHHRELLYVGLSRALSGTLQAGETAAGRCAAGRVRCADSGHATCGEGLQVLAAAELAEQGLDAAAVQQEIERLRTRTFTFAVARDIGFGVRGGRVPRWAGPLVEGLGLTPIARLGADGRLKVAGALIGRRDVPRRFAAYIARRLPCAAGWRVLIGHCDAAEDGETLRRALAERLGTDEAWLVDAGPAIGVHAGPGALVVGLQAR